MASLGSSTASAGTTDASGDGVETPTATVAAPAVGGGRERDKPAPRQDVPGRATPGHYVVTLADGSPESVARGWALDRDP